MVFVAHYSRVRLAVLALLGLLFAALGGWMLTLGDADFLDGGGRRIAGIANMLSLAPQTVAHGIGWVTLVMGIAVLPIVFMNTRHKGPAIRIDQSGIYWHRWSDVTIPWSNVDALKPVSISGQKMVGITLADPSLNARKGLLGRLKSVNNALGFGHLSLTLQGTDGHYEKLLEAMMYYASTQK